jgi:hypothetical protein
MMTECILTEPDLAQTAVRERRRQGPVDVVGREFLPLMGGTALLKDVAIRDEPAQSHEAIAGYEFGGDQLPVARAIGFALVLLLPFWAIVGLLAWKLMHMLG